MTVARHLESGCADMAGFTGLVCNHMIDRLGFGSDTAPDRMASGAIPGGVLEYALHMALFALQSGMHILQHESRFVVVERNSVGYSLRLNDRRKPDRQESKNRKCFIGIVFQFQHDSVGYIGYQ